MTPPIRAAAPVSTVPSSNQGSATRRPRQNFETLLARHDLGAGAGFERWWAGLAKLEGTLTQWHAQSANVADRGGRTHYGITERAFMACAGAAGLPKTSEAFENMTKPQARAIALSIWKTSGADRIADPGVAVMVGDWFWGSNTKAWQGIRRVLSQLERPTSAARVDGSAAQPSIEAVAGRGYQHPLALDEACLSQLNSLPPERLVRELAAARKQQHQHIIERAPEQDVFLRGWQRRVDVQTELALELLAPRVTPPEPEVPEPPPSPTQRIPA